MLILLVFRRREDSIDDVEEEKEEGKSKEQRRIGDDTTVTYIYMPKIHGDSELSAYRIMFLVFKLQFPTEE